MSSESIRRQDEAGMAGLPLCVWRNGDLVAAVENYDDAERIIERFIEAGDDRRDFEVLLPCPRHPLTTAVDCLDCEPTERSPR